MCLPIGKEATSEPQNDPGLESVTLATAPARHIVYLGTSIGKKACQIIRSSYSKLQRKVSYIQNTFPFCSRASSSKVTAILVSRITAFFGH